MIILVYLQFDLNLGDTILSLYLFGDIYDNTIQSEFE